MYMDPLPDMLQRRARAAGLSTAIGNHTFRVTGITAYLENGGTAEHAQQIANHESPKTTKLYDRSGRGALGSGLVRELIILLIRPSPEGLAGPGHPGHPGP